MGFYILGALSLTMLMGQTSCFDIFQANRLYVYNFSGSVEIGARIAENPDSLIEPTNFRVHGLFQLQRIDSTTVAAWITPHGELNFGPTQDKAGDSTRRMPNFDELRAPFKIITGNGAINYVALNTDEPIWTANLKRAFASVFQLQAEQVGLLKIKEGSIHGFCETEYLVANHSTHYKVRKTVDLASCSPHTHGIHYIRSNIPSIPCKTNSLKKVIVSNEALYELKPHEVAGFYIQKATVKGFTMINIFESTGSAQYINSQLEFHYIRERQGQSSSPILTNANNYYLTSLEYVNHNKDPTAGRSTPTNQQMINQIIYLLNYLTDILESSEIDFKDPIDSHVAETFRIMSLIDLDSLKTLFKLVDIGTSYRQETIRNLFLEIIPRIGTKASVLLTRDLVVNKNIKPTTAVQLLVSLPFHIDELSEDLVKECETLLNLGSELPDVKQAAILSFSNLIHHTYMAGKMRIEVFEKYVKKYFDYFLNSHDYEQQMLYIQALANLEQGNVVEYLEPIIKADYPQNTDIRFLAIFATMSLAHTRPEKSYETYWPIFESRDTPVQLRVAAFIMLLLSNPSPARFLSLHEVMESETCPHLLNFYITTIQSLKRTTYPCYQHLKEVVGFISRHLPKPPHSRYWFNGNYLFDYIHESGIGGLFNAMIIADEKTDMPHIGMFELKTEALGKYTGQMSLYIKARGVADILERSILPNIENMGLKNILSDMKLNPIPNTPLHFEMVIKMEGKAVLSYHLNQTIFDDLAQGDIMARLATLLMGDTHINMQSIRWPFMNKYNVPTVLGTPASVVIGSTVATTLRGNITIPSNGMKIVRNQQIDTRYSSYSMCQSMGYNPFLNFEHQIKQEQGFLGYLPVNSELTLNLETKAISLSFIRPKNIETGFALKSKLSTGIYEFLLLGEMNNSQVIYENSEADLPISFFNHDFSDLGLSVKFDIGYKGLYRNIFNPSENWFVEKNLGGFNEDGHSRFVGNYVLQLINIVHVSATHLGNYKYAKFVLDNKENSRIIGTLNLNFEDDQKDPELETCTIEAGLEHFTDLVDDTKPALHKWSGVVKLKYHPISTKSTTQIILKRTTASTEWRMCLENQYEPLIFTKKPETFKTVIFFGEIDPKSAKKCPSDKSKMEISGSFNVNQAVEGIIGEMTDELNEICPKKLIHFDPPILKCEKFNALTKVTDYELNLKTFNMPEWYTTNIRRLDHLYSSFTTAEKTHWEKEIQIKAISPVGDKFMNVSINGISVSVLDIANIFNSEHDIRHHSANTAAVDLGILQTCAVIGQNLVPYHDKTVDLSNLVQVRNNKTCSILLLADCSSRASFAVFLEPILNSPVANQFGIRYFIGETSVTVSPLDKDHIIVEKFGENKSKETLKLKNRTFQDTDTYLQYSNMYLDEENILNVDHDQFLSSIQYNMENLLQISTMFNLKTKVCGLCHPQSRSTTDVYSYCFK